MRLIIVEDQLPVLKRIKKMLEILSDDIELVMVHCNAKGKAEDFPPGEEGWYSITTESELYKICGEELKVCEGDHYLLDVTLFQESQVDKKFSDYISVKLANYITNKGRENVEIKFYTYPRSISPTDFARETKKWGKPIYRPKLEESDSEENEAQNTFVEKIKEYCNV
ncbi:MAG: hypothetical protein K2H40_06040 [Lachnospiraceae bacterium]|nr:hypothetical protein [Lachnospiraceae bacterium]